MTNPTIKIHNVETGEVIEREMNADELAQHEADVAASQDRLKQEAAKKAEKAALLEKLGISEDEAKLLLG
jgi:hypothetical protein